MGYARRPEKVRLHPEGLSGLLQGARAARPRAAAYSGFQYADGEFISPYPRSIELLLARAVDKKWLDIGLNSDENTDRDAVHQCLSDWTGDINQCWEIVIDPSSDLEVDITSLFNTKTHERNAG